MFTEDISNMPTYELAYTNFTCTYTQTRVAPMQADRLFWGVGGWAVFSTFNTIIPR